MIDKLFSQENDKYKIVQLYKQQCKTNIEALTPFWKIEVYPYQTYLKNYQAWKKDEMRRKKTPNKSHVRIVRKIPVVMFYLVLSGFCSL